MERLEAKYQLGEYLASGGCGTVMLCSRHNEPSKPYVLKYINLNELTKNKAAGSEREAQLMSKLDHENIVKLVDVFECDHKLHLIMEYCSGGDLRTLIRKTQKSEQQFTYEQIRTWMIELCSALVLIHRANILHRDIKPENIFLGNSEKQNLKIGDLGISRTIDLEKNERAKTRIGTPRYVAPEVLSGKDYLFSADIWSLGILFVELITLDKTVIRPRQQENTCCGVFSIGTSFEVDVPEFDSRVFGKEMYKIACKMLQNSPKSRPSASDLVKMFKQLPTKL